VESTVVEWISHYGYVAIFVLLMLGIVGLPVPDDLLLVFSGFLVSQGALDLTATLGVGVLGAIGGISLSYEIGRFAGPRLVDRYGRWLHLSRSRLDRVQEWFARVGKWSLTFGYFVPGVRHLVAIVAGSARLAPGLFAVFAYTGAALWCCSCVLLGYYAGHHWRDALYSFHRQVVLGTIVLAVTGGVYLLVRRHRRGH
jgi:membrane protein DedA with SNARE-associated domain